MYRPLLSYAFFCLSLRAVPRLLSFVAYLFFAGTPSALQQLVHTPLKLVQGTIAQAQNLKDMLQEQAQTKLAEARVHLDEAVQKVRWS